MKKLTPFVFMMAFMLAGCLQQLQKKAEAEGHMPVDGLIISLLPPESFGKQIALTQSAIIIYENNTHELLLVTELSGQSMVVVGLLPTGTRVFTITFDGENLHMDGYAQAVEKLPAAYLLLDIQLSLWPYPVLQKHYQIADASKRFELLEHEGKRMRVLMTDKNPSIQIQYSGQPGYKSDIQYKHLQRKYEIELKTLDYQELGE